MALTILILLPLAGAAAVWILAMVGRSVMALRLALGVAWWTFVATLATWLSFDPAAGFQFVERVTWVEPLGVSYHVGVDGVSLALITLTAWLVPLALVSSWRSRRRAHAGLAATMLVLEAAAIATFAARDLLLFFVSSEVMVLAVVLLIGIWGRERRGYASTRFLIYQQVGSGLMLFAILWIAWRHQVVTGVWTFALAELVAVDLPVGIQTSLWLTLAFACAIRTPLFPLHTWWPDALAQAPGPAGVLLAGIVVNVGGYAFLRIVFPLLPEATAALAPWLAVPAVIGIVHAALGAMAQADLRRVVAYMSIGHLGLVVLGACTRTAEGIEGALVQLVTRGVWTGGMLLVIGLLAERRETTFVTAFGGLWRVVPGLSVVFLIMAAAAMALPATQAFPGATLVLEGAFRAESLVHGRLLAVLAGLGVVLWSLVTVRVAVRVVGGALSNDRNRGLRDLTAGEWLMVAPLGVMVVVLGVWPAPVLALVAPAVHEAMSAFGAALPVPES